jgi:hypothetical protein
MFKWYQKSTMCIIYLADFEKDKHGINFQDADIRWFSRGWTLQELVAPREATFYDSSWARIGGRADPLVATAIEKVTCIDARLLQSEAKISDYSVAHRMSWAAHRDTTEAEDRAYSLQGIFDMNMSPMYGEGGEEAFLRLQHEIINRSSDLSIFAWNSPSWRSTLHEHRPGRQLFCRKCRHPLFVLRQALLANE